MFTVDRAAGLAAEAHAGQTDKAGEDYFSGHLCRVAKIVRKRGGGDAAVAVAYLHDTLEDTDITYEFLLCNFGHKIADAVQTLTRGDESYESFIERCASAGGIALEVKRADVLDHLANKTAISDSLIRRYEQAAIRLWQ